MRLTIEVEDKPDEVGVYTSRILEHRGLTAYGSTKEEALIGMIEVLSSTADNHRSMQQLITPVIIAESEDVMTLAEFNELTKGLPLHTELWITGDGMDSWNRIKKVEVRKEQVLFAEGTNKADALGYFEERMEIRIRA